MINKDFPIHRDDFLHDRWSLRRYNLTLAFIEKHISEGSNILDLGTENGLGNFISEAGYNVVNTRGEDFDTDYKELRSYKLVDAVTALEVLEHLMSPLQVLQNVPGKKLIASVPLRLWFAPAFKNKNNPAGWHYHEFEQWQFDWLLEKAGWEIVDRAKYTSPSFALGFRTLLRWVTPRIYIVYAERNK
jgi:hypothetical protein